VAQLYIRDVAASAGPRPVRELERLPENSFAARRIARSEFKISAKELGYYDTKGNWLVEPGKYQLWLAKDSASGQPVGF
jgi:beta-glucosidase